MTTPVESPNLPLGSVKLLVIGERYRHKLEEPLDALGVEVLWLPDSPLVDSRVAGHADLSLLHMGGATLIAARWLQGSAIAKELTNREFAVSFADGKQGDVYPADCALNGCFVGRSYIHKKRICDTAVICAMPPEIRMIDVNQGYSRCSVCVVDSGAVMTADAGIAAAADAAGLDVLRLTPGHVALDGFEAGFPGGASLKLSRTELAFTGTLDNHPDKQRIDEFLKLRGVSARYLTDEPLFDIGGAVLLAEQR